MNGSIHDGCTLIASPEFSEVASLSCCYSTVEYFQSS